MRYVGKYGRVKHAIDDKILRHMRFACWIPKTTNTLRVFSIYFFPMAEVVT
jgi:hypothetical protein